VSRALTLPEAAKELRKSKRWLQDWLANNPVDAVGRPFCSQLGRSKVFRESDISRILDATMKALAEGVVLYPIPQRMKSRSKKGWFLMSHIPHGHKPCRPSFITNAVG